MPPRAAQLIRLARAGSALVFVAAVVVVVGWLTGRTSLTTLSLPGPTPKTNTAVALASLALANLLLMSAVASPWRRRAGAALASLAALIGGLTLAQHLTGVNLGIDELLATEPAGALATTSPNRMGPPASIATVLLGLSLLLIDRQRRAARVAGRLMAFLTCGIAILPLMGFAYGFQQLYGMARYTGIAMSTALALLILGLALQAGRPRGGLAALMCRDDEVGAFSRRIMLATHVLPFGLGWVLARLYNAGLIDAPFALAATVLVLIMALAALVWRTGVELSHAADARLASERALSEREQSLRESDRQKSEFIATLSHELRNPLAPIRFAVSLLQGPPEVAARARVTIERQVRHLTHLVDDLLDLTRITRARLELRVRPCALTQLIDDAVDAVRGDLERGRHALALSMPDAPVWLHADPDRVVQIIVNLLGNAIRYSAPGTPIRLAAAVVETRVVLTVTDAGQGIAEEDLDRIFERFVQVGGHGHGGLGIGLALVKALAELHGGGVAVRSDGLGTGAEFTVWLPRAEPPSVDLAAPATAMAGLSRRVLVVDDNRDAADMLAALLRAGGHEVLVAYDGPSALRQIAGTALDLGLLDIGMPGMDGYELARRLRATPATAGMRLVAVTGWGQESDRKRARERGFDAHLTKPVAPEALWALLADVGQDPRTSGAGSPRAGANETVEPHPG